MIRRRKCMMWLPILALVRSARAGGMSAVERARVEGLIKYVESRTDVTFLRNGNAYSSRDAAAFLWRKLDHMASDVSTALEFIEHIASHSSSSGQAYEIRFADGHTVTSAKFLGDELRRLSSVR